MGCPRGAREANNPSSEGLLSATVRPRVTHAKSAPFLSPSVSGLLDHVGCHASRSMRPRIGRNRVLVKWLSANYRMTYRACRMRRPPVLNRRCCKLVSDQLWINLQAARIRAAQSTQGTEFWDDFEWLASEAEKFDATRANRREPH